MKAVLHAALEESGREPKAVADEMGVRRSYLYDALNEAEPQRFPADLLVSFMKATGSRRPLCWLAQQMDCAVVALPTAGSTTDEIHNRFMRVVEELGQDSAVIQRALVDGEISTSESQAITAELRGTIDALLEVIATVEAKASQKPSSARMTLSTPAAIARRA